MRKMNKEEINLILGLLLGIIASTLFSLILPKSFGFIAIILYTIVIYFCYRLIIRLENINKKRIFIPLTPIRTYGKYNEKYLKEIIKNITNILIDKGYYDIDILEAVESRDDKWTILASKLKDNPKEKIKRKRDSSTNIRPKIILNKGEFKLEFFKLRGDFVTKESKELFQQLKRCKHLTLIEELII